MVVVWNGSQLTYLFVIEQGAEEVGYALVFDADRSFRTLVRVFKQKVDVAEVGPAPGGR